MTSDEAVHCLKRQLSALYLKFSNKYKNMITIN